MTTHDPRADLDPADTRTGTAEPRRTAAEQELPHPVDAYDDLGRGGKRVAAPAELADPYQADHADPAAAGHDDDRASLDDGRGATTPDTRPIAEDHPAHQELGDQGHRGTPAGNGMNGEGEREPLFPGDRAEEYTARWDGLKGGFVDEPRQAVDEADRLVKELLNELQGLFERQRQALEQGQDSDQTSTEDLRIALGRYRSFFDRLLSV